jgi:hypothetical protein
MQVKIGKTKIEASGAYVYIKAFGREVFVKRESGHSWKPYVRRDEKSGAKEIWSFGLYAVV